MAPVLPEAQLPVLLPRVPAHPLLPARLPVLVPPVVAHLAVDSALPPDLLRLPSFSAATARSSP